MVTWQVTRASGAGPVLLVIPEGGSSFEAWSPLRKGESRDSHNWMHEGLYEVLIHSKAYSEHEWVRDGVRASPWNVPSEATLPAGATIEYGVRLLLAPSVEQIPAALLAAGVPVATPLPAAAVNVGMAASVEVLLPAHARARHIDVLGAAAEPPTAVGVATGDVREVSCGLVDRS